MPYYDDSSDEDEYKVDYSNGKVTVTAPTVRTSVPGVRRPGTAGTSSASSRSASISPQNASSVCPVYTDLNRYARRAASRNASREAEQSDSAGSSGRTVVAPPASKYSGSFSLKDLNAGSRKSPSPQPVASRPAPVATTRTSVSGVRRPGSAGPSSSPSPGSSRSAALASTRAASSKYERPEIVVTASRSTKGNSQSNSQSRNNSTSPKIATSNRVPSPKAAASPKASPQMSRAAVHTAAPSASPTFSASPKSPAAGSPCSPSSPSVSNRKAKRVVLWDLDDTLILWDSLKSKYDKIPCSSSCGIDEESGAEMFDDLLPLSKEFQEDYLDQMSVSKLQADELSAGTVKTPVHSLASNSRYRNVTELFGQPCSELLEPALEQERQRLLGRIERASNGWLTAGKKAASSYQAAEGTVNVIITASRLMAAISKMMLFDLNSSFNSTDIYSCWMRGKKLDAFRYVQRQYPNAKFMAIGDGNQECDASSELGIPFIRITKLKDIQGVLNRV